MPMSLELTLKIDGHADVQVRGHFADAEVTILQHYLEQYDLLVQSKPLREGFPCHISVKAGQGTGMEVETALPDNDTLSILLHRLRPFILQTEPASFVRVCAIIGKRIDNPSVRGLLRQQSRLYDGRTSQRLMKVALNEQILNSEKLLYDWLNSHEYHRDPDKREVIDELVKHMPDNLMRGILVSMLVDKVQAIRNVAALLALIFGKSKSLEFQTHKSKEKYG
jgi:hypothetical protein